MVEGIPLKAYQVELTTGQQRLFWLIKTLYLSMIMVIQTQVSFKLHSQLVLLVAEFTIEHLSYFFHLGLNFLLTLSYNLDFHNVQEAGSRSHQVIKTARNSQDLPKLFPYDISFPSKDTHISYMLPSANRCRFQKM